MLGGHRKTPVLEPFGEQAEPGAIPVDNLDQVGPWCVRGNTTGGP